MTVNACAKAGQLSFDSRTGIMLATVLPDKSRVRTNTPTRVPEYPVTAPWALEMKAVSDVEPLQLVRQLSGAISGCGGWVLSRGTNDTGRVSILFEFERKSCLEIYSVLVAAGVELSQNAHIRMTELCQCTRNQHEECGSEIASVDLVIQTAPRRPAKASKKSVSPGEAR